MSLAKRRPPRIARAVPQRSVVKAEAKKDREARAHVELVRMLPCAATGKHGPSDPHHLMTGEGVVRGVALKSAGRFVIPLDHAVHMACQTAKDCSPEEYLMREYGLDARALTDALWSVTPDIKAMQRAVFRAFQEAQQRLRLRTQETAHHG